jgi:hypothetical protein
LLTSLVVQFSKGKFKFERYELCSIMTDVSLDYLLSNK